MYAYTRQVFNYTIKSNAKYLTYRQILSASSMFQIILFIFSLRDSLLLAVKLLCNPRQIDNVTAAVYWNTLGAGLQCYCRSSVTTLWPLRLSRVDEVIAQLLRISAVPDGWLLRVCVYGTSSHTLTHGTRRHQTCVVLVTVPLMFLYQTNSGICSTGAGQQRSLTKLSSVNMKSQQKETHTNCKRWWYVPDHNFSSAAPPNFAFLLCTLSV